MAEICVLAHKQPRLCRTLAVSFSESLETVTQSWRPPALCISLITKASSFLIQHPPPWLYSSVQRHAVDVGETFFHSMVVYQLFGRFVS